MARNYVTNTTSLWSDSDFTALTPQQQALYLMLKGQREITAAGTLPLTMQRWTQTARGWTRELIAAELEVLAGEGHVAIDRDTEELLLVKFVKFDGGYRNEKRRPVIDEMARAVISPSLCGILADELEALDALPDTAKWLRENALSDDPCDRASDAACDDPSDKECRLDRVVVTEVSTDATTRNPLASTLLPAPTGADERTRKSRLFDDFWRAYPRRVGKGEARKVWDRATRNIPPELIIDGAKRYAKQRTGKDPQFTPHPSTWLNREGWTDEPDPAQPADQLRNVNYDYDAPGAMSL